MRLRVDFPPIEITMIHVNWKPSNRDLRIFAAGQWLLCMILMGRQITANPPHLLVGILLTVSLLVGLIGLIWPARIGWIYSAWMMAVFPIGWIVSYALLTAVFGLVLIPLGLLLKCLLIDTLSRRFETNTQSYWVRRGPSPAPGRYFRPF
jgi:hypothetical protein